MEHGLLRYEITLVRPDGSEKILDRKATAHKCRIMENRHNKLVNMGLSDVPTLRFRPSEIVYQTLK